MTGGPAFVETGVVVESVPRGGAGATAGLRPGDVLLTWTRAAAPPANPQPASGTLRTVFDVLDVLQDQSPRGPIEVDGWRDGLPLTLTLREGDVWLQARPVLAPEPMVAYDAGRDRVGADHARCNCGHWDDSRQEREREPAAIACNRN